MLKDPGCSLGIDRGKDPSAKEIGYKRQKNSHANTRVSVGAGEPLFFRMGVKNYVEDLGLDCGEQCRAWVSELWKGRQGPTPGTFPDTVDGSRN